MIKTKNLISYEGSLAEDLLSKTEYPWEALPLISQYILDLGPTLPKDEYEQIAENIWVHKTATIANSASINGPLIVGADSKIVHSAYIRENALIGNNCTVGNSTELKNVILINHVDAPHYNYVGDSILAPYSHLGAGSITSNFKADHKNVHLYYQGKKIETGLRKFGAILGDHVEIGCNAVLNPGSIIGKNTIIYPLSSVRGFIEANMIYKNQNEIVEIK